MTKLELYKTAQSLSLPTETLERWIRQGRIPVHRQGGFCVFNRAALEKWAAQHKLPISLQGDALEELPAVEADNLFSALQRGGALYDVPGKDPGSALAAAVDRVVFVPAEAKEKLIERLIAREELSSTGIGKGVAIPHPRKPLAGVIDRAAITTCFLKDPVDFGAIDDRPVFVMFLILCPDVKIHLQMLSRLAFCLRNDAFVAFLKSTPEQEQLLEKVAECEAQLDG
jgi:PTS system nitrogen regulatory IIA component